MTTYRIIDTSTGNVVSEIEAEHININGPVVTFTKNYSHDVCGVIFMTQGMSVLEKSKKENE